MFDRTPQGIANQYLFYNVDFVVYCEGREADDGSASMDEVFWKRIFALSGRNVKCMSRGSKSSLKLLANFIIQNEISHVVVAMDRDYDDFRTRLIDHPQVIYTYGYSWESDSISAFDFQLVLGLFANVDDPDEYEKRYDQFIKQKALLLKRIFALDLKYFDHNEHLFDRNKPMSLIIARGRDEPTLNRERILNNAKALGKFQVVSVPKEACEQVNGMLRFHGKTVARFIYHWFVSAGKRIPGRRNVAYLSFMSAIISTISFDDLDVPRNQYFDEVMDNLMEHV